VLRVAGQLTDGRLAEEAARLIDELAPVVGAA
jgi:hypothetical protein